MQSSQCSRNPSFSTESPTFVRSSHWLYMNASWDRRRRRSDNMRPPGPVIDPELNFTRWMCFPTSCVPRLLSPSRRSPLHSITDTYVAGSKVVDTIAWPLYSAILTRKTFYNTSLTLCQQYPIEVSLRRVPSLKRGNFAGVRVTALAPPCPHRHDKHQHGFSCLTAQRRERPLWAIFALYWEKWTLNDELLLLWECKSCEIIQGR